MADPYYTVAEIRDLVGPIADGGKYSAALLTALIADYEELAERARGVAYRHREASATFYDPGCRITLPHVMIVTVDSVTVDGTAWDAGQIADLKIMQPLGWVDSEAGWGDEVVITYTHGYANPPSSILRGCREFVRSRAIESQSNKPRQTVGYTDDTGQQYSFDRADWNAGKYTGLPSVDDAINTATDFRVPGVG